MSPRKLTAQQEAFCQAYVAAKGRRGAASNAYREAYPGKMGADAVASNAKKLLRSTPIRLRIIELREGGTPGEHGLTPKQDAFARFYVQLGNASEAYRRAYDVAATTKPETVHVKASELLRHAKVAARIAELRSGAQKRHEISQDRWLAELGAIGFGRVNDVFDWGETIVVRDPETGEIVAEKQSLHIKARKDLPDRALAMIASLKQSKDGCLEATLHKKTAALDAIGKHFGWFEKDNRQRGEAAGEAMAEKLSELEVARRVAVMLSEAARVVQAKPGGPSHVP